MGKVRRRQHEQQQRSSRYSSGRRPYYSSRPSPGGASPLSARLPTFLILSSFLLGWLLGRHEGTRGMGVRLTLRSRELVEFLAKQFLVFYGLAPREVCEAPDGKGNRVAFCSVPQLLGKLARERVRLERRMTTTKEYGSYYRQIFNDVSTKPSPSFPAADDGGRRPSAARREEQPPLFASSLKSTKALSRRMLIKHLRAVIQERSVSASSQPPPTFTWVTAGDATAAAHGNLFSQSYTAVLQDTAENAFEALGIRFEAKNFGMGQYSSGPELGLCMNEVFGDDIDVLMWDFASLQPGSEPARRSALWSHRAGLHPTRPILFSFDAFGDRFVNLDAGGTGTVLMDANALQDLRERMPDSNVVLHLPDSLRNFRCGAAFEGGVRCSDPMRNFICYLDDIDDGDEDANSNAAANSEVCRSHKFKTKPECIDARYQMSWHPGWKDHMLKGRLIGHFLINSLEEALFELDQLKSQYGDDPETILSQLERSEARGGRTFRQKPPDTKLWDEEGIVDSRMDAALVLRAESICHTALLPSRSRAEGISTENENGEFDKGKNQYLMQTPEDGLLPLAFDANDRQLCELLEVDHKDFFLVREQDGWISTVVPNNKELEVYRRSTPVKGIIVICLKICPLNKCPDAYVRITEVSRGSKLFITVDGNPVTNVQALDSCYILEGEKGIRWGKKEQFELRFHINDPGTNRMLKISSIIVF